MHINIKFQVLRGKSRIFLPALMLFLLSPLAFAQDEVVSGTLTVEDDIVLKDRDLGGLTETAKLIFEEDVAGLGVNTFYSWMSENGAWSWGYDSGWTAMSLSENHVLNLYNTDTAVGSGNGASIVLNPGDGALGLIEASILISGSKVITKENSVTLLTGNFIPVNGLGSSDSLLMQGSYGGDGVIPVEGAGLRMMWYPEKGAFRVGGVSGLSWDDANTGSYSFATGYDSAAYGFGTASMGVATSAYSYSSFVIGSYNDARYTETGKAAWQGDDLNSVFEVGVGTASAAKNALTVLQDGSVEIGKDSGLKVSADGEIIFSKAQGDISMGIYGEPVPVPE